MKKLIIDTDPGVDDAIAIALACKSDFDILGLTTVYGNATIEDTTRNAATILKIMRKEAPIFRGAEKPLVGKNMLSTVHGDNGLGGFVLKNFEPKIEKKSAYEFILKTLDENKKNSIDLCILGPSTNIAEIAQKSPDVLSNIKRLIILGGAVFAGGNVTPYAEFNVYNDPQALEIVLNLSCQKILIPVEVCRKVIFNLNDFNKIKDEATRIAFRKISDIYIKNYMSNTKYTNFSGGVMYDLLTIAYLLDPSLFTVKKANIEVVTKKGKYYGMTKYIEGKKPNCILVTNVNAGKLKKIFFKNMNQSKPSA